MVAELWDKETFSYFYIFILDIGVVSRETVNSSIRRIDKDLLILADYISFHPGSAVFRFERDVILCLTGINASAAANALSDVDDESPVMLFYTVGAGSRLRFHVH